jgi:GTP-binding protein HflX
VTTAFTDTLISREIREKIILVGVTLSGSTVEETDAHLHELSQLVETAGADVVGIVTQKRESPDPATYIGKGKVAELVELAYAEDADTVVFDDELTPAQSRNLEKQLGRTAITRTAVILDIFAQNAVSPEGKAQVELALLRYRLPRLRGRGIALSQQSGVIGTRGPGETQLEVDRRRLVKRMLQLERELKQVTATRATQRAQRARGRRHEVALVGYTNAGKSSLLNALTGADVLAADRLFATLDPRTRQFALPGGETILVTDTVGFIRKLPHELVEAFRSTLDSVHLAELIIHVVDGLAEDPYAQIRAVDEVLSEIGAEHVPQLLVVNKIDAKSDARNLAQNLGAVPISAMTGEGIPELLEILGNRLRRESRAITVVVPFDRGDVLAALHREGEVLSETEEENAMVVRAVLDQASTAAFAPYLRGGQ